jgi:hypothetical protein
LQRITSPESHLEHVTQLCFGRLGDLFESLGSLRWCEEIGHLLDAEE